MHTKLDLTESALFGIEHGDLHLLIVMCLEYQILYPIVNATKLYGRVNRCRVRRGIGAICIAALSAGVSRASANNCWKP